MAQASAASVENFAAALARMSAQKAPDMDKYIAEVKQKCREAADKGFTSTRVRLADCLSKPEEIRQEVERLGIQVERAASINHSVLLSVRWPERALPDDAQEGGNRRKKRRTSYSQDDSVNFATELTIVSARIAPDMDKYVAEVKRKCREAAAKGFTKARVYLFECLSEPEEVRQEVEMLGLQVTRADSINNSVRLEVQWPKQQRLQEFCQPSGLESGNFTQVCKVCLDDEIMCRLHPCGHLIGKNCAKAVVGKSCPFCRKAVRFVHAVFDP